MTIIAWDGKTLAADKQATNSGFALKVTKIYRFGDELIAAAGESDSGEALRYWYMNGADIGKYPDNTDPNGYSKASLMVISRDGTIRKFEMAPHPILIESGYCAMGSGRDYALATMHLGYDARKAVEVASALDVDCGLGIDVLMFDSDAAD